MKRHWCILFCSSFIPELPGSQQSFYEEVYKGLPFFSCLKSPRPPNQALFISVSRDADLLQIVYTSTNWRQKKSSSWTFLNSWIEHYPDLFTFTAPFFLQLVIALGTRILPVAPFLLSFATFPIHKHMLPCPFLPVIQYAWLCSLSLFLPLFLFGIAQSNSEEGSFLVSVLRRLSFSPPRRQRQPLSRVLCSKAREGEM